MKFHINKVILWLKNGKQRIIKFEPNKVNVITGDSSTGKSEILDIIDYCFFASKSKISESIVNENVLWYGINFTINKKNYTIARSALSNGVVSHTYYLSSYGEIPNVVIENTKEDILKSLLETEFSINKKVSISYGSDSIKVGSKVSLRYFFMFNTISVNIIENDSGVFFDKQNEERYRDALPRIFDLAVGIESIENILKKEKREELEKQLIRLEKKKDLTLKNSYLFNREQAGLIKKAKDFNIIDGDLGFDESLEALNKAIHGVNNDRTGVTTGISYTGEILLKERKINNLRRFVNEYDLYKKNLSLTVDSLKPISYLKNKKSEIIRTSIFNELFEHLSTQLIEIKNTCIKNSPISKQVNDSISALENELSTLKEKQELVSEESYNFSNEKEKYFFLGEMKAKLELYSPQVHSLSPVNQNDIADVKTLISKITPIDTLEKRTITIKVIEEIISDYISQCGAALANYSSYQPVFDYKNKSLLLRKPKSTHIEHVGSSSNHMFLHLFFSLAMQEVAFRNSSPFVAPYLIIDQPSRPYWGGNEPSEHTLSASDEFKIATAFELLNNYIETRKSNGGEFQIIVFEHVQPSMFTKFNNFHLVEVFEAGNALIPVELLSN